MILRIPETLQAEIDKYFNLQIGGKSVRCPYFINPKISPGNLRVMSGKGTAEEIELETKIWAKVKHFDLIRATEEEIRQFMISMKIGIDCSGLIVNAFNGYLKAINKPPLVKFLKFEDNSPAELMRRWLKPVQNIDVDKITSLLNVKKINQIDNIRPGDMVRMKGDQKNANHIILITEVEMEGENISRIKYVNSNRMYEDQNGLRYGEIVIIKPQEDLRSQDWNDTYNGRNYIYEEFIRSFDSNYVCRFKFVDQILLKNGA